MEFIIVFGAGFMINFISLVIHYKSNNDNVKTFFAVVLGLTIACLPLSIYLYQEYLKSKEHKKI